MHLRSLTDEELISLARTKLNATGLENEMAQRLAAARDEIEALNDEITRLEKEVDA